MSTTTTTLGTPCARTWTESWITTVNETETQLNRRICGARLPNATPCTNTSNHASGRCPHHGGFDLTGAPPGNRNHVIHGIYSRRLRTCAANCPYGQACPCATANHEPGAAPSPCPYQQIQYNTVLTDALAIVESQPHPNPIGIHLAHNVATLQVLVSDAATYLANQQPTDAAESPNPNATIAFIRLMREFRASLKLLATPLNRQKNSLAPPSPEGILRHAQRIQHDTSLDPDAIAAAQLEPQTPQTHARAYLQQAVLVGSQGRDVEMCEAFDTAALLDEPLAESERDHVLACYRPAKHSISEELAQQILGHLHIPPPEQQQPKDNNDQTTRTATPDSIILQQYLDLFRHGKIPPEAFPLNSPLRQYVTERANATKETPPTGTPPTGTTPTGTVTGASPVAVPPTPANTP